MDYFNYRADQLFAEDVPVTAIVRQWGTPCYIYSRATLERHWHVFDHAFENHPHQVCYAVKANSNIAVLNILAQLGSGFDIVSQGELERVLVAGGEPGKSIFSGVGKLTPEIERALQAGICCFNVESKQELIRINAIAGQMGKKASISLRVNPDINVDTHPYIATGLKENKFGIDIKDSIALYELAATLPHLIVTGVGYHIGSQLTQLQPLLDAFDRVYELTNFLRQKGFKLKHLDIGGGLGVRYANENPPSPAEYIGAILKKMPGDNLELIVEPGRAIAANAGILVTRVEYLKHSSHKNFTIVDAAMNDLLRPSLYNAYQEILPVIKNTQAPELSMDIVGPVCETGDFLAKNRSLRVSQNDLLAIRTAGAYGFTMSSNYNTRPRVAEILVDKDQAHLIRRRESIEDLFAHEQLLPVAKDVSC